MNPRLIALTGPRQGSSFDIGPGESIIGRDASNWICLTDISASRRHCSIKRDGSACCVQDLNSMNGTFVNDVPVHTKELTDGDRIAVGNSLFVCSFNEEISSPSDLPLQEAGFSARTTVRFRMDDAYYLNPQKIKKLPLSSQLVQDFSILMKVSTSMNQVRTLEQLGEALLGPLLEVIPAERGALLLLEPATEEFVQVFSMDHRSGKIPSFAVSSTILGSIKEERTALISNDLLQTEGSSVTHSLKMKRVASVLAVPLLVLDQLIGIVYLDTSDEAAHFEKDSLQLLAALSGIAAVAITNVQQTQSLERENKRLQKELNISHGLIGESGGMRDVYQMIAKVAPADSTVLIQGESGTGKELVARAICLNSKRADKPFVAINCAALTETLLESELFGHEKGAFTGAIGLKKGRLEAANGGTVFLDEVAELSPALQSKLLRVLQEREIDRVGGTRSIRIDVRFIAATNKDLKRSVEDGSFRQDLYYRLNVVTIAVPALRERAQDIPLLATYFASRYGMKAQRKTVGISPEARNILQGYPWPGNVRELENVIERAIILGCNDLILPEDLPEALLESSARTSSKGNYYDVVLQFKRDVVLKTIRKFNGNYKETANALGIHVNNLHRLIRNLDLKHKITKD